MRSYKLFSITIACTIVMLRALGQDRPTSIERDNYGWWTSTDAKINIFADSLNFWSTGNKLPEFLFEALLDLSVKVITHGDQKPELISMRKAIFDRVVNEMTLKAIIESKDKRLDDRYNPKELESIQENHPSIHGETYPDLPYMKYSTRELAKRRLSDLIKKKKLFNK